MSYCQNLFLDYPFLGKWQVSDTNRPHLLYSGLIYFRILFLRIDKKNIFMDIRFHGYVKVWIRAYRNFIFLWNLPFIFLKPSPTKVNPQYHNKGLEREKPFTRMTNFVHRTYPKIKVLKCYMYMFNEIYACCNVTIISQII